MKSAASGYALILLAALLWSLLGVFARSVLEGGVGPLEIAFWRAAVAGAAFAFHARLVGVGRLREGREGTRDLGALAAFALVGVTLFYAALNLAIEAGGISLAFILLYTAPAFVVVLAWPLLGERVTVRKLGLLALATFGVVLVARSGGGGTQVSVTALAWGLTAGASYAAYYLFGKWVLSRYAPVTIFAWVMPIGAIGLLPFIDFAAKTPGEWGALLAMALLSTYLAYLVYYTGLRTVEASRAVLVATIEPVAAAAWAAAVFGERLGLLGWAGAGSIVAAALIAAIPAGKRAAVSG